MAISPSKSARPATWSLSYGVVVPMPRLLAKYASPPVTSSARLELLPTTLMPSTFRPVLVSV